MRDKEERVMRSIKTAAVLLLVVVMTPASALFGQTATGEVNGTVTDSAGGVIPGAAARLINQATKVGSETSTNARGYFVFVNVRPSTYVLKIEIQGFKTAQTAPFDVGVNQAITQPVTLAVGGVNETVEVTVEAPMLQQSSSELGTVITERALRDLPLNGGNFTQLLTLTPGATPVSTAQGSGIGFQDAGISGIPGSSFSKPSIHGQQNRSTLYFLDGIINTDLRGPVYGFLPIIDMTDEFKVQSHNDKAEYGGVVGGVVNMTSKSGGNDIHGAAWEQLRNDRFDARNPFTDFDTLTRAPKIGKFNQNKFGGTVSGPIVRNRTFFSIGYEGWRYSKPSGNITLVPTPAELNGDFTNSIFNQNLFNPFSTRQVGSSFVRDRFMCDGAGNPLPTDAQGLQQAGVPCNKIPQSLISPQMQALFKAYLAAPNFSSQDPSHNFLENRSETDVDNSFQARVDHHFETGDTLFVRFSRMAVEHVSPIQGTNETTPSRYHAHNYGGGFVHFFKPNLILDVSGGVLSKPYVFNQALSAAGTDPLKSAGLKDIDRFGGLVATLQAPFLTNDIGNRGDSPRDNTDWSATANLNWLKGNHNIKTGYQYIHVIRLQENTFQTFGFANNQTGDPANLGRTGSSFASALLGLPTGGSGELPDIGAVHFKLATWSAYVQDEWKVNPNFTVNLGLRWDVLTQPEVIGDRLSGALDLNKQQLLIGASSIPNCSQVQQDPCLPGTNGLQGVPFADHIVFTGKKNFQNGPIWDNIGPRLGIAWRIGPSTVLRAGYGLYYDALPARSQYVQNDLQAAGWPWTTAFSLPSPNGIVPASQLQTIGNIVGSFPFPTPTSHPWATGGFYDDPNFKDARSHQWNLEIQRQLGRNLLVAVAYVGSKGERLPYNGRGNAAPVASPNGTPFAQVDALRPMPFMTSGLNWEQSIGTSSYNALDVKVQRNFANGLQSLLSYTWSKCIDTSSGWFGAENGMGGSSAVQNYFDINSNRSVCSYDIPHFLSWATIYELPAGKGKGRLESGPASWFLGNWQASYILQMRSGQPFNLTVTGDIANIGGGVLNAQGVFTPNPLSGYGRPNLVPGANPIPAQQTAAMWFDPTAFSIPSGSFGNFGRNVLRSQRVWNVDFSLMKRVPVAKDVNLELHIDAFNVFNHINLGVPTGTTIGQAGAGVINGLASGTSPRQFQFSARVRF